VPLGHGKMMAARDFFGRRSIHGVRAAQAHCRNGFPTRFVLHKFETSGDLDRLIPAVPKGARMAVTYKTVRGGQGQAAQFPKLENRRQFRGRHDHGDAGDCGRPNTISWSPISPTSSTKRRRYRARPVDDGPLSEFVRPDRYLRSGAVDQPAVSLSVGSLRDRKVRHESAWGRGKFFGQANRAPAGRCRVPVVDHSRNPAPDVIQALSDLIEMSEGS